MTAPAAVKQAALTRALKAADKAGFRVAELRPDGTVLVYKTGDIPVPRIEPGKADLSKYEDVG